MRAIFVISLLLLTNLAFCSVPDSVEVYDWEDLHDTINVDEVVAISFAKMRLDVLPDDLEKYKNVQYLILRKNRLTELPDFIAEFKELRYIDLSLNRLTELPGEICGLPKLEELILNRNEISSLPMCISEAMQLTYIDLWNNPVRSLPITMKELSHLKKVDLSGIKFAPSFQERWINAMPQVTFVFEEPCDCME